MYRRHIGMGIYIYCTYVQHYLLLASFPGLSCFYVHLVHAKYEREFFLVLMFRVYQVHIKRERPGNEANLLLLPTAYPLVIPSPYGILACILEQAIPTMHTEGLGSLLPLLC